jgi:hypothetical protein
LDGDVPSVDELRRQIQREREAYVGRQLTSDTSCHIGSNPSQAASELPQEAAS